MEENQSPMQPEADRTADNAMMLDTTDDDQMNNNNNDDAPEFVTADDAVEVQVDDENIPMEEDEEEENANVVESGVVQESETTVAAEMVVDMAQVTLSSHSGPVYAVRATNNMESKQLQIVSGGGDDKAFVHRIAYNNNNTLDSTLLSHSHTDSVSAVAWNLPYLTVSDTKQQPRLLAVGAYDGAIVLYNADTLQEVQTLEGPTDVECLAFHPKGGTVLLVGSSADGTVWMYHLPLNKCLQVFVGHEQAVTCCDFTPDGKWALSASSDGTLRLWAPRTGVCKHVFYFGNHNNNNNNSGEATAGLTCLALKGGTDQQLVLVGAEDGRAHLCHTGTKKVVATLTHFEAPTSSQQNNNGNDDDNNDEEMELPMSVEAVGFSPANPNWCATAGVDGVLKIWDLGSGPTPQCRQVCRINSTDNNGDANTAFGITRLIWHPTLPLVFTSTTRGTVDLWDARNGQLLHCVTGHTTVLNDLHIQYTDDSTFTNAMVVTASDDQTVRVFHVDISSIWKG